MIRKEETKPVFFTFLVRTTVHKAIFFGILWLATIVTFEDEVKRNAF